MLVASLGIFLRKQQEVCNGKSKKDEREILLARSHGVGVSPDVVTRLQRLQEDEELAKRLQREEERRKSNSYAELSRQRTDAALAERLARTPAPEPPPQQSFWGSLFGEDEDAAPPHSPETDRKVQEDAEDKSGNVDPSKKKELMEYIELQENISMKDMVSKYLKNTDIYRGIAVPYCFGHKYLKQYPNLTLSTGFGNEPSAFVVSQNKQRLKEDVNAVIIDLKTKLKLQQMCQSYFGDVQDIPVCSLT